MYARKYFESKEAAKEWVKAYLPKNHRFGISGRKFQGGREFTKVWIHPKRPPFGMNRILIERLTKRVARLDAKIKQLAERIRHDRARSS